MQENTKTQVTLAVPRYNDVSISKVRLFLLIIRHSIFCPSAKAVLRNLERSQRAHFEMWFRGWLEFYDCIFMTDTHKNIVC